MNALGDSRSGGTEVGERARELMVRAVAHAKSGETHLAIKYFERALQSNPSDRHRADAYYWLSKLSQETKTKRSYLERVLIAEPTHFAARRDLAVMDGQLDESDLVDPNDLAKQKPVSSHHAVGRRFFCPQCGGRMSFLAGQGVLECAYCGEEHPLAQAVKEGLAASEGDFIELLATARGHTRPRSTETFECSACGSVYLLGSSALSTTCPSCESPYSVERSADRSLVSPRAILPFQIKRSEARRAARNWLLDHDLADQSVLSKLRGLYLPLWTFDLSGEIPWRYTEYDGEEWVVESGLELVVEDDYAVAASHSLPASLLKELRGYRLEELVPYKPEYIADWPAESYSIPATRAALLARWQILEATRIRLNQRTPLMARDLQVGFAQLLIASYRLALVPVWRGKFSMKEDEHDFFVNGQLGSVHAVSPSRRRKGLLGWLLG